jgi:YGGT family protein
MSNFSSPERIREEEHIEETSVPADVTPEPVIRREEHVVRRTSRPTVTWTDQFIFDQDMLRRLTGLVILAFGTLNGLILLRFLLKLMAANPANVFASFVYTITQPFLLIFQGLTPTPAYAGIVLEFHDLIAIVVYAGLAWLIVRLMWILFARYQA